MVEDVAEQMAGPYVATDMRSKDRLDARKGAETAAEARTLHVGTAEAAVKAGTLTDIALVFLVGWWSLAMVMELAVEPAVVPAGARLLTKGHCG